MLVSIKMHQLILKELKILFLIAIEVIQLELSISLVLLLKKMVK